MNLMVASDQHAYTSIKNVSPIVTSVIVTVHEMHIILNLKHQSAIL